MLRIFLGVAPKTGSLERSNSKSEKVSVNDISILLWHFFIVLILFCYEKKNVTCYFYLRLSFLSSCTHLLIGIKLRLLSQNVFLRLFFRLT